MSFPSILSVTRSLCLVAMTCVTSSCRDLTFDPIGAGIQAGDPSGDPAGDPGGDPAGDDDIVVTPPPSDTCSLDTPAFCETFEALYPGGRGGDLDERSWSFARWGHQLGMYWERAPASTRQDRAFPATFCGGSFSGVLPPNDVRICPGVGVDGEVSGQLHEVFDDQSGFGFNALRIRQPFDFADRTGVVTFDVDAKVSPVSLGHGWWVEVWVTDEPVPLPHREASGIFAPPHHGLGIIFDKAACPQDDGWSAAISDIYVANDYQLVGRAWWDFDSDGEAACFRVADGHLNHLEVRISTDRVDILVTDYDDPDSLQIRATALDLDLPFTRGYVQLKHVQFDAAKDGLVGCSDGDVTQCATPSQTFRWDNIGFDGPALPRPRGYSIPDPLTAGGNDGLRIGWIFNIGAPLTFTFTNVDLTDATSATLSLGLLGGIGHVLGYRLNGGPTHTWDYPTSAVGHGGVFSLSTPVPVEDLLQGVNSLELEINDLPEYVEGVGSIDLSIVTGTAP